MTSRWNQHHNEYFNEEAKLCLKLYQIEKLSTYGNKKKETYASI